MTPKEYVSLSTRLAKDLKAWIEESRDQHGIAADELNVLNDAAEIVERTTMRVTKQETNEAV